MSVVGGSSVSGTREGVKLMYEPKGIKVMNAINFVGKFVPTAIRARDKM